MKKDNVFNFKKGIYGFEDYKNFIIRPYGEDSPFQIMEATDNSNIGFLLISPVFLDKKYEIDVKDERLKDIGIKDSKDILVLSIVSLIDKETISANLKSPIILSVSSKKGQQVILDNSNYSTKHIVKIERSLGE